ncbi:MAG: CPBP family intramembrane glutamic endopeptidase [Paracoccaceae bacterium]
MSQSLPDIAPVLAPQHVVVTGLILFGYYVYLSSAYVLGHDALSLTPLDPTLPEPVHAIFLQIVFLGLALFYLSAVAGWNALALPWGITVGRTLLAIPVFLALGLTVDLAGAPLHQLFTALGLVAPETTGFVYDPVETLSPTDQRWRVAHALVNGIYEELYFVGIVLATRPDWRTRIIWFSFVLRFAFHTYQGLESALLIALLGPGMLAAFVFLRALWPLMLAHAIADIFGLSAISLLFLA